jgi:hypothetical protein
LLAGAFWLGSSYPRTRVKNWDKACLVICPGGFALVQGPLKGEMRWEELKKIQVREKSSFASGTEHGPGMVLTVAGASILIADIYHRPIGYIHELIEDYRHT